jgi:hypothetical protein
MFRQPSFCGGNCGWVADVKPQPFVHDAHATALGYRAVPEKVR